MASFASDLDFLESLISLCFFQLPLTVVCYFPFQSISFILTFLGEFSVIGSFGGDVPLSFLKVLPVVYFFTKEI